MSEHIIVQGVSMFPRLKAGDELELEKQEQYRPGDIVVFPYEQEGILVHRVLKAFPNRLLCKGDNSLRVETTRTDNVYGRVTAVRRGGLELSRERYQIADTDDFCRMAMEVNEQTKICKYDRARLERTAVYREYHRRYLEETRNYACEALLLLRRLYRETAANGLDWAETARVYERHGILEQLSDVPSADEAIVSMAKARRAANRLRHTLRRQWLGPVLESLSVPYAVIKGWPLANMAYTNESYRGSMDVDLLIDRADLKTAETVMLSHGFVQGYVDSDNEIRPYSRERKVFYLTATHQAAPFIKPTGHPRVPYLIVDINLSLLWGEYAGPAVDVRGFLSDSRREDGFSVLTVEKALLQLCLHMYKEHNSLYLLSLDEGFSLRGFCDVYGLIKRQSPDAEAIVRLAGAYGIGEYVWFALHHTAQVFDDKSLLLPYRGLEPDDPAILDRFGLTPEEYQTWPADFFERLFHEDRFSLIRPLLRDVEWKKIEQNHTYM